MCGAEMLRDITFEQMADFVAETTHYPRAKITLDTGLRGDVGMDGDDAAEFFEAYLQEFGVDLSSLRWDRHFGPEFSFFPVWMLFPSWWKWQKEMVEIRLSDLLQSARAGVWTVAYENKKPPVSARGNEM
jgi:acyl carrier protein